MDAKAERQAEESRERHYREYRRQHHIPDEEWAHAEESEQALQESLEVRFWDLYNQNPQLWADTQRKGTLCSTNGS
jgi:hypothetical protein